MKNSQAYVEFVNQLNATGRKRLDGYNPNVFENIYEWERTEIEELIWSNFVNKNDSDLAIFMPKLTNYEGIKALQDKLNLYKIPSGASVYIAEVLYESTGDENYIKVVKQNIDSAENEVAYVASLTYCKPCKSSYEILVDVYINSLNEIIRSTAVSGILYNKGFIKDMNNIQEVISNIELEKKFVLEEKVARIKMIQALENGKLDTYKKV